MKDVVEQVSKYDDGFSPTTGVTPKSTSADILTDQADILTDQIGPYKILELIGEGGMGSVYMAEQTSPIRRRVAVKVIKVGMDTKQVVARFEAERQALAMMDHPNIAKVLDAGVTEQGQPYFAMELVHGIPITQYCDNNKLSLNDRLKLFVQVCRAIQHAHHKGVIHRDLKPSNVIVALHDEVPVAKVIDFGLAKAMQPQIILTEKSLFTDVGQIVGTWEYMSPEQAQMNDLGVDTRTDVYALGVILYELLTGTTPLSRERIHSEALHRILEIIREEEPSRPSTRLSESGGSIKGISRQHRIDPRRLSSILKGELDSIAIKALEKDRTRRYEGAGALADDVWRYLNHEVILARSPSFGYRLNKTIRKHKAAFASGTAIQLLLIAGLIGTGTMWARATVAEREARQAEADAKAKTKTAIAAEEKSEKKLDIADANFEAAQKAVDDFFITVSEPDLLNEPQMEPLQKKLLEKALDYYREVVSQQAFNPKLKAKLGDAHGRVGSVLSQLGEHEDAVAEYEEMRDIFELLDKAYPGHPEYAKGLVRSYHNLSISLDNLGKYEESISACGKVIAIYERLAEGPLHLPGYAEGLGTAYNNHGSLLQHVSKFEEAVTEYHKAIEIFKRLVQEHQEVPEYANSLAMSYSNFANLLKNMDKPDEAVIAFGKAIEIRKLLAKEYPRVPVYANNLVISYDNVGRLEQNRHRYSEAIAHYQRSLELLQSLEQEGQVASCLNGIGQEIAQRLAFCKQAKSAIEKLSFDMAQPPDTAAERLLIRGSVLAQ